MAFEVLKHKDLEGFLCCPPPTARVIGSTADPSFEIQNQLQHLIQIAVPYPESNLVIRFLHRRSSKRIDMVETEGPTITILIVCMNPPYCF